MTRLPFHNAKVLVVGDAMLDQYLNGEVRRISPEAPVPVARIQSDHATLGGAANVAANVAGLGGSCVLATYMGNDAHRKSLQTLLQTAGIELIGITSSKPTIAKVRVLGGSQQMLRLDYEEPGPYTAEEETQLLQSISTALPGCGAVVISDYGKGCCSEELCQQVISWAAQQNIPVLVDPKTTDWNRYRGADLITPNLKEYSEAVGYPVPNEDEALQNPAQELCQRAGISRILVTRSEKGMTLLGQGETLHVHTEALEVFDVSGAGDTVIATLAAALAAGNTLEQSIPLANAAAGVVVGKAGTIPIQWLELRAFLRSRSGGEAKIVNAAELCEIIAAEQAQGRCVVFTNGCFDLLHRGHLTYLRTARALGHRLVVALNSDQSVRTLKGPSRPIHAEQDRALMMAALEFVDYVIIFNEETPEALLAQLRPDILVKGGDYTPETVLGSEYVREVHILPFVTGYSTTSTIAKMNTR